MDTLDTLLRSKGRGRAFYQTLDAESSSSDFRSFCALLAEDETRQESAIKALAQGRVVSLYSGGNVEGAKGLLRRLSLDHARLPAGKAVGRRLGEAMAFEARCVGICREMAHRAGEGLQRELFLRIAAEAETHFTLLEHMRELVHGSCRNNEGRYASSMG